MVFGGSMLQLPEPERGMAPRQVLERRIAHHLQAGPVFVAFSGGRDSSAVLALAIHVARREALTPPVPLTRVYPGVAAADETDWQEQVVRHLGVTEWMQIEVAEGQLDALGPIAAPLVRRFGPLWPPGCHQGTFLLPQIAGGTLLTGEGGDAVFGRIRLSTLHRLLHRRQRPLRTAAHALASELGPRPLRRRRLRSRLGADDGWRHWLRPAADQAVLDRVTEEALREPLRWLPAMSYEFGRRRTVAGGRFTRELAAEAGVELHNPLMEPEVLAAFGGTVHPWGFTSRGDAMRMLVGDLLPEPVLVRRSKATFNDAVLGPFTRGFVRTWRGETSLDDLVDADRLRSSCLEGHVPAGIIGPLQQAWLDNGAP